MVKIPFMAFDGEIPRMDQHYLPESNAAEARNVKLTNGTLRPLRAPLDVHTFESSGRTTIYYHGNEWLSWFQDADAVPGPVAQDRLYITRESNGPQMYVGGNYFDLPLEAPVAKPSVSRSGNYDETQAERTVYAFTQVTIYGEETAPSPLSDMIMFSPGTTITVGNLPVRTEFGGRPVLHNRIYRSQTTTAGVTELFYIGAVSASASSFTDAWGQRQAAEPIPSMDFAPAPNNLRGLTAMPNGIMAGFVGKELMFCEPYQPHAWPFKYRLKVDYNIVGLVTLGSTLMVLTTGTPYVVQGLHPEAMAMVKMEVNLPCVSKQSIVDMGYSAIYASPFGLVNITEGGAELMSRELWTKDEWSEMGPATIKAGRWGEVYVFTHTQGDNIRRLKLVNTRGDKPALIRSDITARGLYTHWANSELFLLSANGQVVSRFDSGEPMSMLWRSKRFRFAAPTTFGAMRIERADVADPTLVGAVPVVLYQDSDYAVLDNVTVSSQTTDTATLTIPDAMIRAETSDTIRIEFSGQAIPESWILDVYTDGNLLHSFNSGAGQNMRPPAGEYRDWQFVIRGTDPILSLTVASTPNEAA